MRTSIVALLLVFALALVGLAACGTPAPDLSGGKGEAVPGEAMFKIECAS